MSWVERNQKMPAVELEGRLPAHKQIQPEWPTRLHDAQAVTGVRKVREVHILATFNDAVHREDRIPRQPCYQL